MSREDKMPIMEHEVMMTSSDAAVLSGKTRGRSGAWKLAICTVVIFLCAFVFLMLFLVTPIFFSLNHPLTVHQHTQTQMPTGLTDSMTSLAHSNDSEKGNHGDRRRRDVTDVRQQMMKLCGCDTESMSTTVQLQSCMRKCFRAQRFNNDLPKLNKQQTKEQQQESLELMGRMGRMFGRRNF